MKHLWKTLCILTILFVLAGCGAADAEESLGNSAGSDEKNRYMVRIEAGDVIGSGVIYSIDEEKIRILTAAHVVADASQATVYFYDGLEVAGEKILVSDTADLAMIEILAEGCDERELQPDLYNRYAGVQADKKAFDALQAGDACTAVGYSYQSGLTSFEGSIINTWTFVEDYNQYMLWVRAGIEPGMSGGGLFDSAGSFIGILSGGSEDGELVAVPLSLIYQFEMSW